MTAGGKRAGAGRKKATVKTKQIRFSIEPEHEKELKQVVKLWKKRKSLKPHEFSEKEKSEFNEYTEIAANILISAMRNFELECFINSSFEDKTTGKRYKLTFQKL